MSWTDECREVDGPYPVSRQEPEEAFEEERLGDRGAPPATILGARDPDDSEEEDDHDYFYDDDDDDDLDDDLDDDFDDDFDDEDEDADDDL